MNLINFFIFSFTGEISFTIPDKNRDNLEIKIGKRLQILYMHSDYITREIFQRNEFSFNCNAIISVFVALPSRFLKSAEPN